MWQYGIMTYKSGTTPMAPEHHEIPECIREGSALDGEVPQTTERLTLRLRLKSKRKAHALAVASNRSIAQVIEELIENCPEIHSAAQSSYSLNPTTKP
jgi:hypothetical protein